MNIKKMTAAVVLTAGVTGALVAGTGVASAGIIGTKAGHGLCWDSSKSATYNTLKCLR